MVVGASLAFIDANIFATAGAIGFATFTMVTLGVMLGRGLGHLVGERAELVGGVVLIAIGGMILYEHLGAA
jgi:putative Mn2+ efflux pump MntP